MSPGDTRVVPGKLQSERAFVDVVILGSSSTAEQYKDRVAPVWGSPGFIERVWWIAWSRPRWPIVIVVAALGMPLAGLIVLGVMRQSMARAKVRTGHVLRVAIYSADALPFVMLPLIAGAIWVSEYFTRGAVLDVLEWRFGEVVLAGVLVLWLLRFHEGVRLYLGFRRPWSVALVAGVIAWLLVQTIAVNLIHWR